MRVAMYSTKPYESAAFRRANERSGHEIVELEDRLRLATVPLADGAQAVCVFVNDVLDEAALTALAAVGRAPRRAALRRLQQRRPRRRPPGSASTSCGSPRTRRTRWPSTRSP